MKTVAILSLVAIVVSAGKSVSLLSGFWLKISLTDLILFFLVLLSFR
jgi:hypothetical protein